jgi:hypothetical protein
VYTIGLQTISIIWGMKAETDQCGYGSAKEGGFNG